MRVSAGCEIDRIVFDSGLVRVGAFRCHPDDSSFHDSGPARHCCFVFPRTAVEIQHEHAPANPNVAPFYNQGQAYLRNAVSIEGDRCDWFGVEIDVVQDVVRPLIQALMRIRTDLSTSRAAGPTLPHNSSSGDSSSRL